MIRRYPGQLLACCIMSAPLTANAQQIFAHGFEESCLIDNDSDRLPNCEEAFLRTDLNSDDTDGDGLLDGDEVLGTLDGLNLPAFGVNPRRLDILVEADWVEDTIVCESRPNHVHRPTPEMIAETVGFFATLPFSNPDGTTGVNAIFDYGQGGVFTGGNQIADNDGTISVTYGEPYLSYREANFAANRVGYFRYTMFAHFWANGDISSGYADVGGDNSIITLNCAGHFPFATRNTIIHELGHNFGLQHGGFEFCNRKPNYNSIMNYNHQFSGLDTNCDRYGEGPHNVGFSDGSRPTLDQNALIEASGVCGAGHPQVVAIDWNNSGAINPGPVAVTLSSCTGQLIEDHDDFSLLDIRPRLTPGGGAPTPTLGAECAPTPTE